MPGLLLACAASSRCSGGISCLWLVAGLQLRRANLRPDGGDHSAGPRSWCGVKAVLQFACRARLKSLPPSLLFMLKIAFSRWVWCLLCRRQLRFLVVFCFQIAFLEINTNIHQGTMGELFFVKPRFPFFLESLQNVKRSFPAS